jgi:hypothetical protein
MTEEKIELRMENGRPVAAVVLSKNVDALWVVLGESVKCKLMPTRNGLAYAGSVMGRELIYERSVKQVQADILKEQQEQEQHRYRPRPR